MTQLLDAMPRFSVWLYKVIDRKFVNGRVSASARYSGRDPYIDLTPMMGDGSSVRTTKSVREPAGGFTITLPDKPHKDWISEFAPPGFQALESIYGLCEPMDIVEIRMWNGVGELPIGVPYPIIMRGFVSQVSRSQGVGEDGRPQRVVTISGQDYGKIWQTFQVLYLPAYVEGKGLLTNFALSEMFGVAAVNAMKSSEFIKTIVDKIINPHLEQMMAQPFPAEVPRKITHDQGSITVKRGMVNLSNQNLQGSLYEIMKFHGDVGVWNELYTEDQEDGVHVVYRSVPFMDLETNRVIQADAVQPPFCAIQISEIQSISVSRTDAAVANFYWVDNPRFDLITDVSRKQHAAGEDTVSIKDYPNSAKKYYGVRAMYASTQQGEDSVKNMNGGDSAENVDKNTDKQSSWIDTRRKELIAMNRDNVVFEDGTAKVKGGPMRPDGVTAMRAGDYAVWVMGDLVSLAYVHQIEHEFSPYQGYTTTIHFSRCTGFADRVGMEGGSQSPWLVEQTSR